MKRTVVVFRVCFFLGFVLIWGLIGCYVPGEEGIGGGEDKVLERIIIGGTFTQVGGNPHANIARLNENGSEDTGFTLSTDGDVNCIAGQYTPL